MWMRAGCRLTILVCCACLIGASLLAAAETSTVAPAAPTTQPGVSLAGPRTTQPAGDQARQGNRRPAQRADRPQLPPPTDEQIEQMLSFIREEFPTMHERLSRLREQNPETFRRNMNRLSRVIMPMLEMKLRDPEIAQKMIAEHRTQMQIEQVTARYRAADNPQEKERLRRRLRELLGRRFDLRMDRLRAEIRNLERRLQAARLHLEAQEAEREQFINDRLGRIDG